MSVYRINFKESIENYKMKNKHLAKKHLFHLNSLSINGVKGFDISLKYYDSGGGEQRKVGLIKKEFYIILLLILKDIIYSCNSYFPF